MEDEEELNIEEQPEEVEVETEERDEREEETDHENIEQEEHEHESDSDDAVEQEQSEDTKEAIEKELADVKAELWRERFNLTLQQEGLSEFANIINVEQGDQERLDEVIEELKVIVGGLKSENSYKPTDYSTVDEYSNAKKSKDVKSMIKSKFN